MGYGVLLLEPEPGEEPTGEHLVARPGFKEFGRHSLKKLHEFATLWTGIVLTFIVS